MIRHEWNLRHGGLPRMTKPMSDKRKRLAKRLWRTCLDASSNGSEGAAEQMRSAFQLATQDEHYLAKGYGFDSVCRHIDRWLDEPGTGPEGPKMGEPGWEPSSPEEHAEAIQRGLWE